MKTYTTKQVWRLLKKHPTWTFEAPRINWSVAMSACHSAGKPTIEWCLNGARYLVRNYRDIRGYAGLQARTDWVRTNKPKPVLLDKVTGVSNIGLWLDRKTNTAEEFVTGQGSWVPTNPAKTYKVYLVECD